MDFTAVFSIAFYLTLQAVVYSTIRIDIQPSVFSPIKDEVDVSCRVHFHGNQTQEIISILVVKEGSKKELAKIQPGGNATFTAEDNIKISGHIDTMVSFLKLTLLRPQKRDSGVYTCSVYYKDELMNFKFESASDSLVIKESDIPTLERIIRKLNNEILLLGEKEFLMTYKLATLENMVKEQAKHLHDMAEKESVALDRITALENVTNEQTEQLDDLVGQADQTKSTVLDRITKLESVTDGQAKDLDYLLDKGFVIEKNMRKNKHDLKTEVKRLDERDSTVLQQLKQLENVTDEQSQHLDDLAGQALVIENDVQKTEQGLKAQANRLDGRAFAIENDILEIKHKLNGEVTRLDQIDSTFRRKFRKLEKASNDLDKDFDDLSDQDLLVQEKLKQLENKVHEQSNDVDKLGDQAFFIEKDVQEAKWNLKKEVTRLEESDSTALHEITKLGDDVIEQSKDLDNLGAHVHLIEKDIQKTKQKVIGEVARLDGRDDVIESDVEAMIKKLSQHQSKQLAGSGKNKPVTFYVGLSHKSKLTDGMNKVCGFTRHYIDSGRDYFNHDDCTFFTPVAGTYWLGGYMGQEGEGEMRLFVLYGKNGWEKIAMTQTPNTFMTGSTIRYIEANQTVRVEVERMSGSPRLKDCYFYGFLI